jgi:hypothetical protein
MADVNNARDQDVREREGKHEEPAKTKSELIARNAKEGQVTPFGVPQATFTEQMREGIPGMINRQVDYNAVSRSAEGSPIPCCRAVSQSTASDIGCIIGGSANGFVGITILDPTNVYPVGSSIPDGGYGQYYNVGVLTKGEMFAICAAATLAGDPLSFTAVDGTLLNTGGVVVPGGRWKYARPGGALNVVQLGIQR